MTKQKKIIKDQVIKVEATNKTTPKNHTTVKIDNPEPDVKMVTKNTSRKEATEEATSDLLKTNLKRKKTIYMNTSLMNPKMKKNQKKKLLPLKNILPKKVFHNLKLKMPQKLLLN